MFTQFPINVTIRTPMHTPRARGKYGVQGAHARNQLGDNIRVRTSIVERKLVEYVADQLGMKKAEFMRWCGVEVAKQLRSYMIEHGNADAERVPLPAEPERQ